MKHFIPIVNSVEKLLPRALNGCKNIWDRTYIIDNRDTEEELKVDLEYIVNGGVQIIKPPVPLTTAQSMNFMLELSKDLDFFTWQHLDAVCLNDSDIKLYELVEKYNKEKINWGVVFTNYDSYAAYNVRSILDVEGWDWKRFPYYFLDNDLHRKLEIKKYILIKTKLEVEHNHSQTIKTSEERNLINKYTFEASEKMYIEKWGGKPREETIPEEKKYNKIFQIGFNKCGTTSIHKFFNSNGLKSIHWDGSFMAKKIDQNHKNGLPLLTGYEEYDCYTDMESSDDDIFIYLTHYEELDKQYPNSKFILNVRNIDKWIISRLNHPGYLDSYKSITGFEIDVMVKHWKESWIKHVNEVKEYFLERDEDFVCFDIETESEKFVNFMKKITNITNSDFGRHHVTQNRFKND
jgi:hypothetical protein